MPPRAARLLLAVVGGGEMRGAVAAASGEMGVETRRRKGESFERAGVGVT